MTNEQPPQAHDREALIEALLQAAYVDERGHVAQRIDQTMRQIEQEILSNNRVGEGAIRVMRRSRGRWFSWSIAAAALLAVFFGLLYFDPTQPAMAAIEKSLAAAAEQVVRRYLITVTFRDGKQVRIVENDLYVQGRDRFALRHPARLPGADFWLGKNGDQTWVVPAIGAVRTGNDLALSRWLNSQEQVSTPYLHVTTVLNHMARGYRLRELGETTIGTSRGGEVVCRHILAERRAVATRQLPETIELWADVQTGVAVRLDARWSEPSSGSGRERVVIEFVEQPDVPENWFDADGHYSGPRRKITLDAKVDE